MTPKTSLRPKFFRTPAALRAWFEKHHATRLEVWVGYYKKETGRGGITWSESIDEALCVGWIDGIRQKVDESSYANRFTPRRRGSVWSAVNIRRAEALIRDGRMTPAGLAAFEARKENRSGIYSYEQRDARLPPPYDAILASDARALAFFESRPPYYRKALSWFIVSAKREETRLARLNKMMQLWKHGKTQ
jgi:uncharacterized protein YdeI (YjbR/CyaY-like superfamily)